MWKCMYLGISDKLKPTVEGPYPIERVFTNGTVNIQMGPNTIKRINIRRIKPRHRFCQIQVEQAEEEIDAALDLTHGEGE